MSLKNTLVAVAAVGALTAATAVPAMALENEFHGMYRLFGYQTNAETGGSTFNLQKNARDTFYAEQRARIMYIAKANDDLRLVTHFELDSRFGGQDTRYSNAGAVNTASNKYPNGDSGGLDADRLILEMKSVYLDFNIPSTALNIKAGVQPFNDAFQGIFSNMDAAGDVASAKYGGFTPTLGWFRIGDNNFFTKNLATGNAAGATPGTSEVLPGKQSQDVIIVDCKYLVNKDMAVGISYYNVQNDKGADAVVSDPTTDYFLLHMVGVNGSMNAGRLALSAFAAYQFGDYTNTRDLNAYAGSVMAKVAAGPGKLSASALYLSGNKDSKKSGDFGAFRQLDTTGSVSYYGVSNMWLLIRNNAMINSSTAIVGTDLTKGNDGFVGFFAGYDATMGKLLASANAGYGMVDRKGTAVSSSIGTELNATVGYKLYDNLTASLTGAYLILGNGMNSNKNGAILLHNASTGAALGVKDADNPYMANIQLNYVF